MPQTLTNPHSLEAVRAADPPGPTWKRWVGRAPGGLAVLFLARDAVGKLVEARPVVEETVRLGYPPGIVFPLGVLLLSCVVIHVIPRTSVLGAVLLTGYLGG